MTITGIAFLLLWFAAFVAFGHHIQSPHQELHGGFWTGTTRDVPGSTGGGLVVILVSFVVLAALAWLAWKRPRAAGAILLGVGIPAGWFFALAYYLSFRFGVFWGVVEADFVLCPPVAGVAFLVARLIGR